MRGHYDPCSPNPAPNFADMAFSSPFLPLPSVKAGDGQNRTHHSQTPPPTFRVSNELQRRASVARTALQAAIYAGTQSRALYVAPGNNNRGRPMDGRLACLRFAIASSPSSAFPPPLPPPPSSPGLRL